MKKATLSVILILTLMVLSAVGGFLIGVANPVAAQLGLNCEEDPSEVRSTTTLVLDLGEHHTEAYYIEIDKCGDSDTDWIFAWSDGQFSVAGG